MSGSRPSLRIPTWFNRSREKKNSRVVGWRQLGSLLLAFLFLGFYGIGEAFHYQLHCPPVPASTTAGPKTLAASAQLHHSPGSHTITQMAAAAVRSEHCALCSLSLTLCVVPFPPVLSYALAPDAPGIPGLARAPGTVCSIVSRCLGRAPPTSLG